MINTRGSLYHNAMTAIVLLSGGQDSTTCLAIAKESHETIHCICFDYGQRHRIEIESSKRLADKAKATFQLIDVTFIKGLSNSAMIHKDMPIIDHKDELPSTFVPGRNALFLTVAAMVAHQKRSRVIYTGVCQTDYSGYPDCRDDFIQSQIATINLAMDTQIKIETPLMHLTKADTVRLMAKKGLIDWYKYSHTCYEGVQPACGKCPACKLRLKGFAEAGHIDPIKYQI